MTITGKTHTVMVFDLPKVTLGRKVLVISNNGHKLKVIKRMRLLNGDAAFIRIIALTTKYIGNEYKITVR